MRRKKLFFQHIFIWIYSNFGRKRIQNLIPNRRSTHVAYFRWTPVQEKRSIHEKGDYNPIFPCISYFSCSRVNRKYATWCSLDEELNFACNGYSHLKFG